MNKVLTFIAILISMFLVGCSSFKENVKSHKIEMYKYDIAYNDPIFIELGTASVEGVIKNVSDKPIKNIGIRFNLYDKNNVRVGEAVCIIDNINPNEAVRYVARGLLKYDQFSYVKLDRILLQKNEFTKEDIKFIRDENGKLVEYNKK